MWSSELSVGCENERRGVGSNATARPIRCFQFTLHSKAHSTLSSLVACVAELLRRSRVHTRPYGCEEVFPVAILSEGSSLSPGKGLHHPRSSSEGSSKFGIFVAARLPPLRGGLIGLAGVTTRPAGYPSGGEPPAVERQLHLPTYFLDGGSPALAAGPTGSAALAARATSHAPVTLATTVTSTTTTSAAAAAPVAAASRAYRAAQPAAAALPPTASHAGAGAGATGGPPLPKPLPPLPRPDMLRERWWRGGSWLCSL
jgi:hypothetical protein